MNGTIKITFQEFSGKKYKYPVQINSPINISDIALQVSKQILQAQIKARRNKGTKINRMAGKRELSPAYNLLMKKLPNALKDVGLEFNMPEQIQTKEQAFIVAHEFNKKLLVKKLPNGKYEIQKYRVGKSSNQQIILDIDNPDLNNAMKVKSFYESLLGYNFDLNGSWRNGKIKSYHLVGYKIYKNFEDWVFDNCRILKNNLERKDLNNYLKELDKFDKLIKGKDLDFTTEFKKSTLFDAKYDFDVSYTVITVRRKKNTVRISKKSTDDRYELIDISTIRESKKFKNDRIEEISI